MIDQIAVHLGTLGTVVSAVVQGSQIITVVDINSEHFTLIIELGGNFPAELPDIYLADASKYGFLPHVCWKSKVCYDDGEGVSIDINQAESVVEYAIKKAIDALSIDKNNREENFFNEFEGYWNRQDSAVTAYSFFEPSSKLQLLKAPIRKKSKLPIAFISDDCTFFQVNNNELPDKEYQFFKLCKANKTQMNAVYLPLESYVNPPLPGDSIDIQLLEDILSALSDDNKELWDHLIRRNKISKEALFLLVSQPRPQGGVSLFGIKIPYGINWLKNKTGNYRSKIIPLSIKRHTPVHMLQRSGGNIDIADKSVAIIGCGSVGSRIAELLIMAGIKNLTLIDGDYFSSDNLFRHVLESRYIDKKKVEALADQFKSRFPYISIKTEPTFVKDLTESHISHDVIIDVSGNPTLGRILNNSHRNIVDNEVPLLLTIWAEPLGLGGHAVLSDGKTNGCLHCLFHMDNSERLSSIFNFVEEGQVVSRNLTGCGGAFTPFSAIDATKTAEMTTRMVIDHLTLVEGDEVNNYRWWRGNDNAAVNEKIKTTLWYSDCQHDVHDDVSVIFNEGCPVCRKN